MTMYLGKSTKIKINMPNRYLRFKWRELYLLARNLRKKYISYLAFFNGDWYILLEIENIEILQRKEEK